MPQKHQQNQRAKHKPLSSGRAAQLLSEQNGSPNLLSFGNVPQSSSNAKEQHVLGFGNASPPFKALFRKLIKKDPVTRAKGASELADLIESTGDNQILLDAAYAWTKLCPKLTLDGDAKVRHLSNVCTDLFLGKLGPAMDKELLNDTLPYFVLATCDPFEREVQKPALKVFSGRFSTLDKKLVVFSMCRSSLIALCRDMLLEQNQFSNMSDDSESIEPVTIKRVRLQRTALECMRALLSVARTGEIESSSKTAGNYLLQTLAEMRDAFFESQAFWKLHGQKGVDVKIQHSCDPIKTFKNKWPSLIGAAFKGRAVILSEIQGTVMRWLLKNGMPGTFLIECLRHAHDQISTCTSGDVFVNPNVGGVCAIFAHWFDLALNDVECDSSQLSQLAIMSAEIWANLAGCQNVSNMRQSDRNSLFAPIERCLSKVNTSGVKEIWIEAMNTISSAHERNGNLFARIIHSTSGDEFLEILLRSDCDILDKLISDVVANKYTSDHILAVKRILVLHPEKFQACASAGTALLSADIDFSDDLYDLFCETSLLIDNEKELQFLFDNIQKSGLKCVNIMARFCRREQTRKIIQKYTFAQEVLFSTACKCVGEFSTPNSGVSEEMVQELAANTLLLCHTSLVPTEWSAKFTSRASVSDKFSHACLTYLAKKCADFDETDTENHFAVQQFCKALHHALLAGNPLNSDVMQILNDTKNQQFRKSVLHYFSKLLFQSENSETGEVPNIATLYEFLGADFVGAITADKFVWQSVFDQLEIVANTSAVLSSKIAICDNTNSLADINSPDLFTESFMDWIGKILDQIKFVESDQLSVDHLKILALFLVISDSRTDCSLWLRSEILDGLLEKFTCVFENVRNSRNLVNTILTIQKNVGNPLRKYGFELFLKKLDPGTAIESPSYGDDFVHLAEKCKMEQCDIFATLDTLITELFAKYEAELLLCAQLNSETTKERITLTTNFARLLKVLTNCMMEKSLFANNKHWDFLCCNALALLQTCQDCASNQDARCSHQFICPLILEVCQFFDNLCKLASAVESKNEDRLKEFLEFHLPPAFEAFCRILLAHNLFTGKDVWLNTVYQCCVSHCILHCTVTNQRTRDSLAVPQLENGLRPLFDPILDECGYSEWLQTVIVRCVQLLSGPKVAGRAAYSLLSMYTAQIAEIDSKRNADETAEIDVQKCDETSASNAAYTNFILTSLSGPREQFLTILPVLQSDVDIKGQCEIPMAYVHLWNLLLNYIQQLSAESRPAVTKLLQDEKQLHNLMDDLFGALPQSLPSVVLSSQSTSECEPCEMLIGQSDPEPAILMFQRAALDLCISAMAVLPALVRNWYVNQNRADAVEISKFVTKYVSPTICTDELNSVRNAATSEKLTGLEIQVRSIVRELSANYIHDDCKLGLTMALAPDYPLTPVSVSSEIDKTVSAQRDVTRKWLLQLNVFLTHQNGRLCTALSMWKSSLDKYLSGGTECSICMMLIHANNYRLPNVACRRCHNKFHNACLYKWFTTSDQSTCPLCRHVF